MTKYTVALLDKEYEVPAVVFWTVAAVGLVVGLAVAYMAIEGIASVSVWLLLGWIIVCGHVSTDNGLREYCVIKSDFWRSVISGVFIVAGLCFFFMR